MRIKFINPDSGLDRQQLAAREALLLTTARPDTQISMICPQCTEVCIDSDLDVAVAAPEIVQLALDAQQEGYDAVAIYCFSDPGLAACREVLSIPVLGGAQCSLALATQLGYHFSVLTTDERRIPPKEAFIRALGYGSFLTSVRSAQHGPDQIRTATGDDQLIAQLAEAAKKCAADGADTVILGCLSFAGLAPQVSALVGIPVIDPAMVLVNTAEMLVAQSLSHSKRAYPTPPRSPRCWKAGKIDLSAQ